MLFMFRTVEENKSTIIEVKSDTAAIIIPYGFPNFPSMSCAMNILDNKK